MRLVETRVHRHLLSLPFDQRSTGFRWFFSFLAAFSEFEHSSNPVIILLDEPGLGLHARAQKDFLRFIEERLSVRCQVAYSTHSPFMIQPDHLERARLVEDKGRESGSRIPIGYLLGTVSITILRAGFRVVWFRRQVPWDVQWSEESLENYWRSIHQRRERRLDMQASSTYVHAQLPRQILDWCVRRWTSFLVASTTIVALAAAHVVGRFVLGLRQAPIWVGTSIVVALLLVLQAVIAWIEVRRMVEFQLLAGPQPEAARLAARAGN